MRKTLTPAAGLLQGAEGIRPNVQIYTSLMDACVKEGSPASLDLALQLLNRMRAGGLQVIMFVLRMYQDDGSSRVVIRLGLPAGFQTTPRPHTGLCAQCARRIALLVGFQAPMVIGQLPPLATQCPWGSDGRMVAVVVSAGLSKPCGLQQ